MTGFIRWSTVGLGEWVEMRTSRSTTIGVVTEFMDVETSFSVSIVTSDVVGDCCGFVFRSLFKSDGTRDTGVTT